MRKFYEAVTAKMLKKFPFNDSTLEDMAFLNPTFRDKVSTQCGKFEVEMVILKHCHFECHV